MATDAPPIGQPGFNLYADQKGRILGSMIALLVLSTTFVMLRLLSRKLSKAGFWLDDYLIVLALVGQARSICRGFEVLLTMHTVDSVLWSCHRHFDR